MWKVLQNNRTQHLCCGGHAVKVRLSDDQALRMIVIRTRTGWSTDLLVLQLTQSLGLRTPQKYGEAEFMRNFLNDSHISN